MKQSTGIGIFRINIANIVHNPVCCLCLCECFLFSSLLKGEFNLSKIKISEDFCGNIAVVFVHLITGGEIAFDQIHDSHMHHLYKSIGEVDEVRQG